ncbi:hypothetical protein DRE_06929 [Drechslerella stenobrocha 248]|uniref:BPL/LPL catalytic domain-containing protein n=1 Tax=Drechslerella stenobrocha 248 TaxID=1043628 RepID=W7HM60_9PEZI|nr:hypothetical protein DRE_06929 [Drechslerella stenobrocha 248]
MDRRLNVLVYTGPGTTVELVNRCLDTFQHLLSPYYAIRSIEPEAISKGQWLSTCALFCLPGGADLGYCRALNGVGNRKIQEYVRRGGKFLGFCAGAYFASASVEFEEGDPQLEVTGPRELRFFPGICRGAAFKGFGYNSEAGARACTLDVVGKLLDMGAPPKFASYYNGGGVFVDAEKLTDQGVEILARYIEQPQIDEGRNVAAAVGCRVGAGFALLIGPHPEFSIAAIKQHLTPQVCHSIVQQLEKDEVLRVKFVSSCLNLLELRTNINSSVPPRALSHLHISCLDSTDCEPLQNSLIGLSISMDNIAEDRVIEAEHDVFVLDEVDYTPNICGTVPPEMPACTKRNGILKSTFRLKLHMQGYPTVEETPLFSSMKYFQLLRKERSRRTRVLRFGSPLLYGEVVTSTNTILEKNFKLLQKLPSGFTAVATTQTAARGRGDNVWISPIGALVFSVVVRHNVKHLTNAPVIFIQYLAALAIVESIKAYDSGYSDIPVYIKWPNDIYAGNRPTAGKSSCDRKDLAKIGGILVNASFDGDEFILVIGCGINLTNEAPTTSLKILAESMKPALAALEHERLLAKILVTFELHYEKFLSWGFKPFERIYYNHWLHRYQTPECDGLAHGIKNNHYTSSNQTVTLDDPDNTKVQIRGLSMDDGSLIVDELDKFNNHTGKAFKLQTDGNSFDFFNGLLKKKI